MQTIADYMIRCRSLGENRQEGTKMTNIGIEPKQYEFECVCGYCWIDSQNNGCPMCGETIEIKAEKYEIKQPKEFDRK